MAKYGISLKGAEAMEKLSRDLLTEAGEILEAAIRLREVCGLLGDDLGVYADGIMSLVRQNTDTLKASKDDFAALAKAAKKRADDIRAMLPENGGAQDAGGFQGNGQVVYRASQGQTQLLTVS